MYVSFLHRVQLPHAQRRIIEPGLTALSISAVVGNGAISLARAASRSPRLTVVRAPHQHFVFVLASHLGDASGICLRRGVLLLESHPDVRGTKGLYLIFRCRPDINGLDHGPRRFSGSSSTPQPAVLTSHAEALATALRATFDEQHRALGQNADFVGLMCPNRHWSRSMRCDESTIRSTLRSSQRTISGAAEDDLFTPRDMAFFKALDRVFKWSRAACSMRS